MKYRRNPERGQVLLAVVCVMVIAMVVALVATKVGRDAGELSRLQSAADLVALAGAGGDRGSSAEVALENGAVLESFASDPRGVRVVVSRDGRRASARAELRPG